MKPLDELATNIIIYMDFCASLESNIYDISSSSSLVSIPKEVRTELWLSGTSDPGKSGRCYVCFQGS